MSNSISRQSDYLRTDIVQNSPAISGNLALDSLRNEFYQTRSRSNYHWFERHSSHSDKFTSLHKRSNRSDRLFDKDSDYQAEQARNKRFKAYEKYDHFKDGTEITRESVNKRLPKTEALTKLIEKTKLKEGASKEEKIGAKQAQTDYEMYCEANYRRVKYLGDKGLIAYSDEVAGKAQANSKAQDARNKCGHFKNVDPGQIAGYGFNNGYSVVMGWMTSPGHRRALLDPNYKFMGASQINVASTINFAKDANNTTV